MKRFEPVKLPTDKLWYLVLRGILVILGGFLVHLTLGTLYTVGNIAPYIVSYIRNQSHPQDLNQGTTTWIFAFAAMGGGGSMFFGGWMVRKIGPRWTTLLSGWFMSLGVAITFFTIKISFWLLVFTYGLMTGIGTGMAYIGPILAAMKWLPKWKGLATGIVVSGFGLGALVFNPVQTFYINPENLPATPVGNEKYFTQPELLEQVPYLFLVLGFTYAAMQLVGALLITNPPDDFVERYRPEAAKVAEPGHYREVRDDSFCKSESKQKGFVRNGGLSSKELQAPVKNGTASPNKHFYEEKKNGMNPKDEKAGLLDNSYTSDRSRESSPERIPGTNTLTNGTIVSLTPLQMLKKPGFYFLWLMLLASAFSILFTATLYKFFGLQVGFDDHFLAIVGSVAAIFNCLGRIVWGAIADNVSYKFALVYILGIMTVFLLTLYLCTLSALGDVGAKAFYFTWICVIFFCIGGVFSVFPVATARSFGIAYLSINYGLVFTSELVSGSIGAFLATVLKERLDFSGIFFLVSGFSSVGLILAILYRPKRYVSLETD